MIEIDEAWLRAVIRDEIKKFLDQRSLCPICGERIVIVGATLDGRLIGSCKDAFTRQAWEEND